MLLAALVVVTAVISYSSCCALRNLKNRDVIDIEALSRADWKDPANKTCSLDLFEPVYLTFWNPWITWSKKAGKYSNTDRA